MRIRDTCSTAAIIFPALMTAHAAFCLVLAALWFSIPYRGTLFALFVTTSLFPIVVLSLRHLISALSRSQVAATQVALLVMLLPTALLQLIYSSYCLSLITDRFLKRSSFTELSTPILFIVVYASALMMLAARPFCKQLD